MHPCPCASVMVIATETSWHLKPNTKFATDLAIEPASLHTSLDVHRGHAIDLATEPPAEPAERAARPATEPTLDLATDLATEPTLEPVTDLATESAPAPASEPTL